MLRSRLTIKDNRFDQWVDKLMYFYDFLMPFLQWKNNIDKILEEWLNHKWFTRILLASPCTAFHTVGRVFSNLYTPATFACHDDIVHETSLNKENDLKTSLKEQALLLIFLAVKLFIYPSNILTFAFMEKKRKGHSLPTNQSHQAMVTGIGTSSLRFLLMFLIKLQTVLNP